MDASVPCEVPGRPPIGCSFSRLALPRKVFAVAADVPATFGRYLTPELLKQRRTESPLCNESWAFCLTGAMHQWTLLAYERLNVRFAQEHFSVEFLLSCYRAGPASMCGCVSADLPAALLLIAQQGVVAFDQFPYVNAGTLSKETFTDRSTPAIYCTDRSSLGTCRACERPGAPYTESFIAASKDRGGFRGLATCLPCDRPAAPRYYPASPYHVAAPSPEQLVAVVKAELVRLGPLPAALALHSPSFEVLNRGGSPLRVSRSEQGVFYTPPPHVVAEPYQAVLIVGYEQDFWICRSSHGRGSFGYTLEFTDGGRIDNLFNVPMSASPAVLLDNVLSCEKILIRTTEGESVARDLRATDPYTEAAHKLIASVTLPAPPPAPRADGGRRRGRRSVWLWAVFGLLLLMAAAAFLVVPVKDA